MKKLFISILFLVAIASFGGIMIHPTRAADLTPAERAALEQSLAAMKAKLIELQAQAAVQAQAGKLSSPAASGAPLTLQAESGGTMLSATDLASMRSALAALAAALSGLQSTIASKPELAMTNAAGMSATLKGIGTTLALMSATLGGQAVASSPAPAQGAAPIATQPTPAAPVAQTPSQPATPPLLSATGNADPKKQPLAAGENISIVPGESDKAETAQVASAWSPKDLNWPLIAVIALVIAAIALWLFWPEGEDSGKGAKRKGVSGSPAKPASAAQPTILISRPDERPPVGFGKVAGGTQTPLTAAMSTPMQKSEASPVKVVPPQRDQQQRKPA